MELENIEIKILDYLLEEEILKEDEKLKNYIYFLSKNCEELSLEFIHETIEEMDTTNLYDIIFDLINGKYIYREDFNFLGNVDTDNFIYFILDSEEFNFLGTEYVEIKNLIELYGRDFLIDKMLKIENI